MDKSLWTNLHLPKRFFTMRQTNSQAQIHLHFIQPLTPAPTHPPPLQCWTRVHAISPEFQHCMGGGGGAMKATHFEKENSFF